MLNSMNAELEMRKAELKNQQIESIYFGGGTPSLLVAEELKQFLQTIRNNYSVSGKCEITLEANPDDFDVQKTESWLEAGINRLSIGIQSFDNQDLLWMNRAHRAEEGKKAVLMAQKVGFSNISIDLIYGLPDMDVKRWAKQLSQAIELNVQHLSAYCLTVEEKTALHQAVKQKKIVPAESDMQSLHFDFMLERLTEAGFIQYEVSNFARNSLYSQHNSSYWKGKPYLGIGPSAHSYNLDYRAWNIRNNTQYMSAIEAGTLPLEKEKLSPKDKFNELLLTGLRTIWGVSLIELEKLIPLTFSFTEKLNVLKKEHLLVEQNGQLILTQKGLLLADGIASDLFAD